MKFTTFIFIYFLSFGISGFAQSRQITGQIKDKNQEVPFLKIYLVNIETLDTLNSETNFNGGFIFENLKSGNYSLFLGNSILYKADTLILDLVQSEEINCNIKVNLCDLYYPIKPCPIDKKAGKTLRVSPHLKVNYSFKNNRKRKQYYRKIEKRGYITYETEGQIVLIEIIDSKENAKAKKIGLCGQGLFCTEHKLLYH